MVVIILKAGMLTTFQDQGRTGYRNLGIPVSGNMDPFAAHVANLLVGNGKEMAVLELTYGMVEMVAQTDILISCCGGGTVLFADGQELPLWKTVFIPAGTVFKFNSVKDG